MMHVRTGFGVALLALLLGACNGPIEVVSPEAEITARTSEASAIGNETPQTTERLGPDESVLIRVKVPDGGGDALYLYIDEELELSVENSFGSLIAFSAGPNYFTSRRVVGLDATSDRLRPADIDVSQTCPGSCVILHHDGSSRRYMEVRNQTSSTVDVGVFAVVRDFEDGNEYRTEPIPLSSGVSDGALETLGDVDEFEVQASGTLFLDPGQGDPAISYEARIVDPFGENPVRTIRAGENAEVSAFEVVRVRSGSSTERAGVSAASRYTLELQTD